MAAPRKLPIVDRPRFVRKMIAVWQWHHLLKVERMVATVWPGEWPEGVPHEVHGVEVREDVRVGGEGGVLILGQVGEAWRGAYQVAYTRFLSLTAEELAVCTAYVEMDEKKMKLWLHPDPHTGAPGPVWVWDKPAGRFRV